MTFTATHHNLVMGAMYGCNIVVDANASTATSHLMNAAATASAHLGCCCHPAAVHR